jgi:hypothetical protein
MAKVIVASSIPPQALKQLEKQFELILFETEGITYSAISNHPDVFICPFGEQLITTENLPQPMKQAFQTHNLNYEEGSLPIGMRYPESAHFNAVVTPKYFIHNLNHTDPILLACHSDKSHIHVNQAYTRCNLLALRDDWFITSDRGIEKTLLNHSLHVLYVNPHGIQLPGFKHGFFGGTGGIYDNTVYFIGDLSQHTQGEQVVKLLTCLGYQIRFLYDGPLFDGGSLFFLSK